MLGIFLDTETNGLDPKKHKILEIAFKLIDVSDGTLRHTFDSLVSISKEDWESSDQVSLKVSGLKWENLQTGKPMEEISSQVKTLLKKYNVIRGKAVFICQNPSFDRAFFSQIIDVNTQESMYLPYHWLDLASMYWSYSIHKKAKEENAKLPWETGFTKDRIAQEFHLKPEAQPHRAMNGVNHLISCYEAVVGFPKRT